MPPSILTSADGFWPRPLMVVMAITPALASEPWMPDCGPRMISMRSMPSSEKSAKSNAPSCRSFTCTPSISTSTCLACEPRIETWVSDPRLPVWLTSTPGTVRNASGTLL